jgi:hypothetical protein
MVMGRSGWKLRAWHARPLAGAVIPANHRGVLVIGVSSMERGLHQLHGFIIDYRIGLMTYSAPQQYEIDLCTRKRGCRFFD